ncbi:MAG: hypothetical protein V3S82_00755 [Dehalococcoidia bacterium]
MGELHIQTLTKFLSILFYDDQENVPASGFPRSERTGSNCQATATADLVFDVSEGWGMLHDGSVLGIDPFGSDGYQMVVLGSGAIGETLAAHDPVDPRVDLILLKPVRTGTQPATRNIKDPTSGALSTASVNLKNLLDAEVVVVTGTPAPSPGPPAIPVGHLLIAHAEVPATAGAAVIRDARNHLHIGNFMRGPGTTNQYLSNHVHPMGVAGELSAQETVPASFGVDVGQGRGVIGGTTRHYVAQGVGLLAAADPVNPRIDIIVAKRDGTLAAVTGTPALVPVPPAAPANSIILAEVAVAALAVTITNADITDVRNRAWLSGAKAIRTLTLPHQAMSVRPWVVGITGVSSPGVDTMSVDCELQYPDGTPYDGPLPVEVLAKVWNVATGLAVPGGPFAPSSGALSFSGTIGEGVLDGLDWRLFPGPTGVENIGTGAATDFGTATKMLLRVTAVSFAVELCRDTGTSPVGTHFVTLDPVGSDGVPMGLGEFTPVTF